MIRFKLRSHTIAILALVLLTFSRVRPPVNLKESRASDVRPGAPSREGPPPPPAKPNSLSLSTVSTPATPAMGSLQGWNVVLITLDAMNAARIGAYGGSQRAMPFFDSLARKGLLVMHAYTITGSTSPAHATLLSGLQPRKHGVLYNGVPLAPGVFWLPEELRKRGYATVGSTVAFFLHDLNKMDRGFDHFEHPTGPDAATRPWSSNHVGYSRFRDHCLPLLSPDKPFFALIHLKGGHEPVVPVAEEYLRRFSKTLPAHALPKGPSPEDLALGTVDPAAYRTARLAYYDANLSEADATLEQIFADFKARGLTKKTLFVITGDHGDSYDHGFTGEHWPSPFESTLHVPLLFYTESGAIPPGRIADRLVSHADFVKTLAYLLGADFEPGRDSDSINELGMKKRTSMEVSSVSSITYEDTIHQLLMNRESDRASTLKKDADDLERLGVFYWGRIELTQDGIYKLLHLGSTHSRVLAGSPVRLYNVTTDSAEQVDLLENGSKKRVLAAGMLDRARNADQFFGLFISNLKGSPPEVRAALTRTLDRETIEKLKSLGYLQ
jgi:Sulfatase